MADISHLPPEVIYALRTGELPPEWQASNPDAGSDPEESEDSERFRGRYRDMVEQMIADWLDEHPMSGNHIPAAERARIEEHCELQIQHQWQLFVRKRDGLEDDEDDDEVWRAPW